jgi:hypothetical protein
MRLIDRLAGKATPTDRTRGTFGPWSWPKQGFSFNGIGYGGPELIQTSRGGKAENIDADFAGYFHALKQSPPAFAAQMKRARYLSQARFIWRDRVKRTTFGTTGLELLERPWPSGTTGELVSKMEWHEGLAGNAFVFHHRKVRQLKVMRPDWVTIVLGSEQDTEDAADQLDAEVIGYIYCPGGLGRGGKPTSLMPADVAHWSPLPDPAASFRGMSWITPLIRDIQGDIATADHKLRYFENGATPNLVVKGIPAANEEEFKRLVRLMSEEHEGVANAYKTLYLASGADATVVGSDLSQVAFKAVQGAGETRIATVGEVPASLLGISEGMQGSSLNAGNYGEAKRSFIDSWLTSSLQSLSACLGQVVPTPTDAELWYSTVDMPIVREDAKDASDIRKGDAQTIRTLLDAGWDPDAAVEFVQTGDLAKLLGAHSGLYSVQLQKPGTSISNPPAKEDTNAP